MDRMSDRYRMPVITGHSARNSRNSLAFWILGACNNFAYVIMLSAAEDILSVDSAGAASKKSDRVCQPTITHHNCSQMSTGSVLLANIIPALIVKIFYPFVMYRVPFGVRHFITVLLQISSFLLVSFSSTVSMGLTGVALASIGSGLGEVTFLSLTAFFSSNVVGAWSSGTGAAGLLGSFAYAAFTDERMLNLAPQQTLRSMLIVPTVFAFTFWLILKLPEHVHQVKLLKLSTYLIPSSVPTPRQRENENSDDDDARLLGDQESGNGQATGRDVRLSFLDKLRSVKPLMTFMVPLVLVYFAEYFINQGLMEFIVFDCKKGFNLSPGEQYRWYQVLYQTGVFLSRSSIGLIQISVFAITLLPVLQIFNALFLFVDAIVQFIPHVITVFIIVFYEGLLGGMAYVNTYHLLHKSIADNRKEFTLSFVCMSDSIGIVFAGLLAIPAHRLICQLLSK